ncbi:hypothetical protein EBB79_18505 [Parasedimentitalea marina]|uniref:Uncharacterized protein n=1 Tax=Parasedimentitalea marina TaxID=2483033 RepID=A0A3T0N6P5_9RHOB|nr:hypothetical protein [Parasedimentitalea marina]AZV79667.1 hypothetical protein EBB79_18505 [Parasedimentitalea marina]
MSSKQPNNLESGLGILIWCLGGVPIYLLWDTRIFINETMEMLFGAALFVLAFFYFLAFGRCIDLARRLLSKEENGDHES